MKIKKIENILIVLVLLVLFVAPINLGKIAFLSEISLLKTSIGIIVTTLLLVLWLENSRHKKALNIYPSKIYFPLIFILAWSTISLFWVDNYQNAFDVLSKYLSAGLMFFLTYNIIKTTDQIKRLLDALIVSMFIISAIGLMQYYATDNNVIQTLFYQQASPASIFVNRNLASHVVVMLLPFSFVFFAFSKKTYQATLYGLTFFSAIWFLLVVTARQAYLAVLLELILFYFILFFLYKNKAEFNQRIPLQKFKLFLMIAIASCLIYVSNIDHNSNFTFETGNKIERITQININNPRISGWVNTFELIKDNPMGVGVGQWSDHYYAYKDVVLKDVVDTEKTSLKNLHNDYIEMIAELGIIGLVLMIWFLYLVAYQIYKSFLELGSSQYLIVALALSLVGFFVVAFFSFPVASFTPLFLSLIFIAFIGVLFRNSQSYNEFSYKYSNLYLIIGLLVFSYSFFYGYRQILSEHYLQKSIEFFNNEKYEMAKFYRDKAYFYNDLSIKNNKIIGYQLIQSNQHKDAVTYLLNAVNATNYDWAALNNLQISYGRIGEIQKQKKILRKILSGQPKNVTALATLTRILYIEEAYDEANLLYKNLKNSYEYYKDRAGFGPFHSIVTKLALKVGDYKYASYIYSDLVKRNPSAQRYAVYGVIEYTRLKNKLKARELFIKALQMDKNVEIPKKIRSDLKI